MGGYPVVDLKVEVNGGSYHPVDSTEIAFEFAASMAFREATQEAGLVLLEPVMNVEIETPEEFLGDVIGDITSRRGNVVEVTSHVEVAKLTAKVALERLFGYTTALRSLTRGRATHSMLPSHFEPVPASEQQQVLENIY